MSSGTEAHDPSAPYDADTSPAKLGRRVSLDSQIPETLDLKYLGAKIGPLRRLAAQRDERTLQVS